jgi:hypothetical protein
MWSLPLIEAFRHRYSVVLPIPIRGGYKSASAVPATNSAAAKRA